MPISRHSVKRFLYHKIYTGCDLYDEVMLFLKGQGGTLSIDDSILDKPYRQYMVFVDHFWSSKHHARVKGINLITLYHNDPQGRPAPINFRVYDKVEGKTKNEYFRRCSRNLGVGASAGLWTWRQLVLLC
ncbi:MAG: hypothetical protein ACU85E_12035 [Gammaproteobacteria bacterium]